MWRKLLMGMRIAKRIREEYGEIEEGVEVFGHFRDNFPGKVGERPDGGKPAGGDSDMAGGFLPEGYDEEEEDGGNAGRTSSFFPVVDEDDEGHDSLLVQDDRVTRESNEEGAAEPMEEEQATSGVESGVHTEQRVERPRRTTRNSRRR